MFAIGFTTFVLLLLAGFLLFFFINYRKKSNRHIKEKELMTRTFETTLLQSQVEVQEATYSGLARELHDNVGQLLSSAKMLLGVTQRNMKTPPHTLNIAEETLAKAINELRTFSKSLDKEWLEQFDLIDNLSTEIKRLNSTEVLEIKFSHPQKLPLKADEQIILFRIIQEALQNAIKHAEAKEIIIEIATNGNIIINITDNGKGISPTQSEGFGIKNMKQRARLLGGTITWNAATAGSSITIQLPVTKNES